MSKPLLYTLAAIVLGAAVLWLFSRLLLPLMLPFLLAWALALAAEPMVSALQRQLRMRRGIASGIGITAALAVAVLAMTVLGALLLRQLGALAGILPDLVETVLDGLASLKRWLLSLAGRAPRGLGSILNYSLERLFSDSTALVDSFSAGVVRMFTGLLRSLPDSALSIGTWILASFMISAKLPQIKDWVARRLPPVWKEKYLPHLKQLKKSIVGWLAAQAKLTLITLVVLTGGFLLLRISYAPLWAVLVSLIDALPILGTGTVLIPWSIICLLQGQQFRAVGLLAVYLTDMLLRTALEPKFVGKHLGLDPLVTLFVMYAGYRLWGIGGMILSPLLAVTVTQLLQGQS